MSDATARMDPERRALLLDAKLRGLLGDAGITVDRAGTFAPGAVAVGDGRAWVLVDGDASRSLGKALAWVIRQPDVAAVSLLVDDSAGDLARRSGLIDLDVDVYEIHDRHLAIATPSTIAAPAEATADHLELADTIVAAGADVVVEHGVVAGEVRGLEVCRVVDSDEGVAGIAVGVGANDRDAFAIMHGHLPTFEALADVVRTVREHRAPGAQHHPLNRLVPERSLRWTLEQEPGWLGSSLVVPAPPPLRRPGLNLSVPCVARGLGDDGEATAIVCSAGVDLDLVGFVADVQTVSDDPVVVVVPERDRVPIAGELLGLLGRSVTLLGR